MARPQKEGMDYFPHDTDARNDLKIRKLRAVYGNDGYTFYFIMLENIYKAKNYELDISDTETKLILAEEIKISVDNFDKILEKCLQLGLFDKNLYSQGKVLTSDAVKVRTEPIENKRKRNKEYYDNKKDENEDISAEVSDAETMAESTQSKVKESKVKNNIYIVQSEQLWKLYPEKKGKSKAIKKIPAHIEKYGYEQMEKAINRYIEYVTERRNTDFKDLKFQNGDRFFNTGFIDYLDQNFEYNSQLNIGKEDENPWDKYDS